MTTQSEILWKYNLNIEQVAPTELLNNTQLMLQTVSLYEAIDCKI